MPGENNMGTHTVSATWTPHFTVNMDTSGLASWLDLFGWGPYHIRPEIYRCFLRLNNRRRTQSDADFTNAGYPSVIAKSVWDQRISVIDWCDQVFGPHGYFTGTGLRYWFLSQADADLFTLTWLSSTSHSTSHSTPHSRTPA